MSSAPANLIEIKAKRAYLSAAELIVHRHAEVEITRIGLKRTNIEGTAEEQEELKNAYANLRQQLSCRRIERSAGRAVALWHPHQQVAEVLRKDGKFESFGFNAQGKLYLDYYEAMFLLELNRLQLEYCEMIVSVEQAYSLLLGEAASEKYNNYLVYSALTRAGYIVVKHREEPYRDTPPPSLAAEESLREIPVTSEACIWALLEEAVSHKSVPAYIKDSPYYDLALSRMSDFKQQIVSQSTLAIDDNMANFEFDTRKRRAQSEPKEEEQASPKRKCPARSRQSLVDQLKEEVSFTKFREIFQKLDIVQLARADDDYSSEPTLRSFKITFDLHLHNEGFRRSAPKKPYFSVIILPPDEPFPTHNEMLRCLQQQLPHGAPPLLVISVSESKQIQAFLYYIS